MKVYQTGWLVWAIACVPAALPAQQATPARSGGGAEDMRRELQGLFEEQWEFWMREDPTWASSLGDRRYADRWPEATPEAYTRRLARGRGVLARLDGMAAERLAPADRLDYDLFRRLVADDVSELEFGSHLVPLDQRGGIQTQHELAEQLVFESVKDYEDWLARLGALGRYVDETIALMREGKRLGVVSPRVIMQRVPNQLAAQIVADPRQSPYYQAFEKLPDWLSEAERARLEAEARRLISEVVVPAYRRFETFFKDEYLPATRASIAASDLPEGSRFYAYRVRHHTTTELTPEAIHALGLQEVKRIRSQMEGIIARTGFKGGFQEFLADLRTNPRFYARSPEELLRVYEATSKRVDPTIVKLFGKLPRMPYGIKPIPEESAPDTTTAYYTEPAADGTRAGTYWVNLYRPEVRPLYEIEALTLHEAVPGHHLQIALAMELGELPKFRRYRGYTAYVEGWGLYAESLGDELGFYQDPYAKFGQLTYEMWRAVRLVVDTGMHSMGWTREQAIAFFKENAAKTEHDIVNEIDRYIAWPGQALAYKVGELKIKELRARAAARLGERFDVRAFHDAVLSRGAVPLDVLEAQINAWIESAAQPAMSPPGVSETRAD